MKFEKKEKKNLQQFLEQKLKLQDDISVEIEIEIEEK